MLSLIVIIVLSYLVGSIPTSVWLGRLKGIDIRQYGSGNAGATNTFRVMGWKFGVAALLIDFAKGVFAAAVIASIRVDDLPYGIGAWEIETVVRLIAGMAAVAGHMFPVLAGFRGGKGVNTSAGVLVALTPWTMVITLAVFFLVLISSRYVSLSSIVASIAFPATIAIRRYIFGIELDPSLLILSSVLALAIIYMHRGNIKRLLAGQENRVRSFRPAVGIINRQRE